MVLRLFSSLPRLFGAAPDPVKAAATRAVGIIAADSRRPGFYVEGGVPDTVEGRFDVLTLHLYALLVAIRGRPYEGVFGQAVFDAFFQNIDDNLREMGVGDTVVGKRIRKLAEAFYGRVSAFDAARGAGGEPGETPSDTLAQAVGRNLLSRGDDPRGAALAAWLEAAIASLRDQPEDEVTAGRLAFPSFPAPAPSSGAAHV